MRRVLLGPRRIAELVVAHLRDEGFVNYPFTPSDLDAEIDRWCEAGSVDLISFQNVREEIAKLPGVSRTRIRLNSYDPRHRYIRRRQRALGEDGERPTVYFISGR